MVYEQREHHESQWAAIESVAQKIGYTAQTLKNWITKAEGKAGADPAAANPLDRVNRNFTAQRPNQLWVHSARRRTCL